VSGEPASGFLFQESNEEAMQRLMKGKGNKGQGRRTCRGEIKPVTTVFPETNCVVVSNIFYFHPYFGEDSHFDSHFSDHQPANSWYLKKWMVGILFLLFEMAYFQVRTVSFREGNKGMMVTG